LKEIEYINENEMYDSLAINVVKSLNTLHKNYNYKIWYKNNLNDVFVRENDFFYHYKFHNNGKTLCLNESYKDVIQ
jgi:hypothetical protein